ncbi:MAG: succinylglutamate desuccinylase/aspartoacylase family protein [Candidatus Thermoplasmatota archaeon]|nr:succinylglutamate desuccinylase/aspartoacylase family protein [Candidatus Thermoplasmatota archaeon]
MNFKHNLTLGFKDPQIPRVKWRYTLTSGKKKSKTSKRPSTKVSNQLPRSRRVKVEKALEKKENPLGSLKSKKKPRTHRFARTRTKPGEMRTIRFPLLETSMGDPWPIRVTVIHGAKPGPVITLLGAVHGDELVGPIALTHLLGSSFSGFDKPLDPNSLAGTIRIVPVLNLPGYRMRSRYFPDGRDLNRESPGTETGNTTSRVANRIFQNIISGSDYVIDLHTAARGRTNLPQIRADLADAPSNAIARGFGIEVILDSLGPRGSFRRSANEMGIGYATYEGGGANTSDAGAVQVALYGILNVMRSLSMIPGQPSRPRARLLAHGSTWIRADQGGLLDMRAPAGRFVEEGEVVATITDPERPGAIENVLSPSRGLLICTATNPYVNSGAPVGHLLPIHRGIRAVESMLDNERQLIPSGTDGEPPWREETDVDEIEVEGEWIAGNVDGGWHSEINSPPPSVSAEEEAAES